MKFKIFNIEIACLFLATSSFANAGIITHGDLTTDTETNYITDTNSGRMYTRLDAFNLNIDDTHMMLISGAAFDGWSIVTKEVVDDFYNALLGVDVSPCVGQMEQYSVNCGTVDGWTSLDFGFGFSNTDNYFAYDNGNPGQVGLGGIYRTGRVADIGNWATHTQWQDYYGPTTGSPINYMLYKDSVEVPEPSTLAIFALGMIGLASRRFKKPS
jgi:hypothetical protein